MVAAALISIAAAIVVLQISPGERETVPVVVAAKSLGAGTVLSAGDLTVAQYPVALAPAGHADPPPDPTTTTTADTVDLAASATTPEYRRDPSPGRIEDWAGRTLSTAVVEGQPLTVSSVVGPDLLAGQPAGTTAVTIRVADPGALTHVRPGQGVDLVQRSGSATDSQPRDRVVARDVTVLWVADPVEPSGGLLSSSTGGSDQDLLVVGTDAHTAQNIAASDSQALVPVLVAR
ncbi:MAG: SAF domain-containing protein [Kocuria sp.]|nr:SAF domain-containing protein [Kocuria sp.]